MTFEIKPRFVSEVISRCDANNAVEALAQELEHGGDLKGADLRGTDLRGAYLKGAYFKGTYLKGAKSKKDELLIGERPVIQIGPIGSRCSTFTAFLTNQGLRFDVGCRTGITKEEFLERIADEHGDNVYAKEYRAALAFVDAYAKIWTP